MLGVQSLGPIAPSHLDAAPASDPRNARAGQEPLAETRDGAVGPLSEREAWTILLSVPGLGPVTFSALLATFGSARATLAIGAEASGPERLVEMAQTAK